MKRWKWITLAILTILLVGFFTYYEPLPKGSSAGELAELTEELLNVSGPKTSKDGFIDYMSVLNGRLSQGVTPEQNAMAILAPTLGVYGAEDSVIEEFYGLLGVPRPKERSRALDFDEFDDEHKSRAGLQLSGLPRCNGGSRDRRRHSLSLEG